VRDLRLITAVSVVALLLLLVALSSQRASLRSAQLSYLAAEVKLGNYYAWRNVVRLRPQLTPDEWDVVSDACAEYRREHSILYASRIFRPPASWLEQFPLSVVLMWLRKCHEEHGSEFVFPPGARPSTDELPVAMFD